MAEYLGVVVKKVGMVPIVRFEDVHAHSSALFQLEAAAAAR